MTYRLRLTGQGEGDGEALPQHVRIDVLRHVVPLLISDPWGGDPLGGP